jgi:hypothetical protein
MFSEGADNKASKGLLDPCGGFFILVLDKLKQFEGQRQKTLTSKFLFP